MTVSKWYWHRRNGLDALYADTLRNMAAKLGCFTVRQMNKGQLADYIIRAEKTAEHSNYIQGCIDAGRDGTGKVLYLGD